MKGNTYNQFWEECGERLKRLSRNGSVAADPEHLAQMETINEWIECGAARELVNVLLSSYDTGRGESVIIYVSTRLRETGQIALADRLLLGHLSAKAKAYRTLSDLFAKHEERWRRDSPEGYRTSLEERRERSENLRGFVDYCSGFTGITTSRRFGLIRQQVERGGKPTKIPTTDKRKIDENVFWDLIEESRAETGSTSEAVDVLREKLESIGLAEIRKFQKLLFQKIADCADWDIWALAYIARNGCGDDAFEYFRGWLVMQGRQFYELALKDVSAFAEKMTWDEDPQCEEALYVAEEAFENKKLEPMPDVARPKERIRGLPWEESDLNDRYSALIRIFQV